MASISFRPVDSRKKLKLRERQIFTFNNYHSHLFLPKLVSIDLKETSNFIKFHIKRKFLLYGNVSETFFRLPNCVYIPLTVHNLTGMHFDKFFILKRAPRFIRIPIIFALSERKDIFYF